MKNFTGASLPDARSTRTIVRIHTRKNPAPTGSWAFASGETYLHCLPPTRLVNGLPVSSILKLSMIAESIELSITSQ